VAPQQSVHEPRKDEASGRLSTVSNHCFELPYSLLLRRQEGHLRHKNLHQLAPMFCFVNPAQTAGVTPEMKSDYTNTESAVHVYQKNKIPEAAILEHAWL